MGYIRHCKKPAFILSWSAELLQLVCSAAKTSSALIAAVVFSSNISSHSICSGTNGHSYSSNQIYQSGISRIAKQFNKSRRSERRTTKHSKNFVSTHRGDENRVNIKRNSEATLGPLRMEEQTKKLQDPSILAISHSIKKRIHDLSIHTSS